MNENNLPDYDQLTFQIRARAGYAEGLRESLRHMVVNRVLKTGNFTLASGLESTYYFDGKAILFDQRGIRLFANWIIEKIYALVDRSGPIAIGGPEIGAIPIASTVAALAPFDVKPFVVRKSAKDHGTSKIIEGDVEPGDTVVLVEDVITTGGSLSRAADAVKAVGASHVLSLCLIARTDLAAVPPIIPAFYASEFTKVND